MKRIKAVFRKAMGERNQGRLDFLRHPDLRFNWGGPFNGQRFRQRVFFDLLYHFPIRAIVETGTYCGETTALFGATSLPVYTVEMHPRFLAFVKMRFLLNRVNIHLHQGDSRMFLKSLVTNRLPPSDDSVFFYLDAHWGEDLPLFDELNIIFSNWKQPFVMIDDFKVPDSEYQFDDYGPGKVLDLDYARPAMSAHRLAAFFPAAAASEETGLRRGSVVLCREATGAEVDRKVQTLVRHKS